MRQYLRAQLDERFLCCFALGQLVAPQTLLADELLDFRGERIVADRLLRSLTQSQPNQKHKRGGHGVSPIATSRPVSDAPAAIVCQRRGGRPAQQQQRYSSWSSTAAAPAMRLIRMVAYDERRSVNRSVSFCRCGYSSSAATSWLSSPGRKMAGRTPFEKNES